MAPARASLYAPGPTQRRWVYVSKTATIFVRATRARGRRATLREEAGLRSRCLDHSTTRLVAPRVRSYGSSSAGGDWNSHDVGASVHARLLVATRNA